MAPDLQFYSTKALTVYQVFPGRVQAQIRSPSSVWCHSLHLSCLQTTPREQRRSFAEPDGGDPARTSVTLYLAATSAAMHVSEWPWQNCRHDTQPLLGSPTKNGWHFSHRSPCGTEIQRLSSDGLGSVVQSYWLRLYSSGSAALVQCLRFRSKDQAR